MFPFVKHLVIKRKPSSQQWYSTIPSSGQKTLKRKKGKGNCFSGCHIDDEQVCLPLILQSFISLKKQFNVSSVDVICPPVDIRGQS